MLLVEPTSASSRPPSFTMPTSPADDTQPIIVGDWIHCCYYDHSRRNTQPDALPPTTDLSTAATHTSSKDAVIADTTTKNVLSVSISTNTHPPTPVHTHTYTATALQFLFQENTCRPPKKPCAEYQQAHPDTVALCVCVCVGRTSSSRHHKVLAPHLSCYTRNDIPHKLGTEDQCE